MILQHNDFVDIFIFPLLIYTSNDLFSLFISNSVCFSENSFCIKFKYIDIYQPKHATTSVSHSIRLGHYIGAFFE